MRREKFLVIVYLLSGFLATRSGAEVVANPFTSRTKMCEVGKGVAVGSLVGGGAGIVILTLASRMDGVADLAALDIRAFQQASRAMDESAARLRRLRATAAPASVIDREQAVNQILEQYRDGQLQKVVGYIERTPHPPIQILEDALAEAEAAGAAERGGLRWATQSLGRVSLAAVVIGALTIVFDQDLTNALNAVRHPAELAQGPIFKRGLANILKEINLGCLERKGE